MKELILGLDLNASSSRINDLWDDLKCGYDHPKANTFPRILLAGALAVFLQLASTPQNVSINIEM